MVNTVERSLRSILNQVDDRFEVLVIDDGSTDGTQEELKKLEEEHDIFRWKEGSNDNLAEARNHSVKEAKGDYILESLDVDDVYEPVIQDFVEIFHQLNDNISGEFYLSGKSINIAPKKLLEEYPYRSLGYGEDEDLWRRLLTDNKIIFIENEEVKESIGYDRGPCQKIFNRFEHLKVKLRSGITFRSMLIYRLRNLDIIEDYLSLLYMPVAYLRAKREGIYKAPEKYSEAGKLKKEIEQRTLALEGVEEKYNFSIDKSQISDIGEEKFL
jgi:glycosyltransferase involved in cell wall biosynthesis